MEEKDETNLASTENGKKNLRHFPLKEIIPERLLIRVHLINKSLIVCKLPYERENQGDIRLFRFSESKCFTHIPMIWKQKEKRKKPGRETYAKNIRAKE